MSSKTITSHSRNNVKRASASRAASSSATRRSTATKRSIAPSHKTSSSKSTVKQLAKAAIVVPLAKRALKNVKSKAGLAVLTGVALAVGAGLVKKYRKAS